MLKKDGNLSSSGKARWGTCSNQAESVFGAHHDCRSSAQSSTPGISVELLLLSTCKPQFWHRSSWRPLNLTRSCWRCSCTCFFSKIITLVISAVAFPYSSSQIQAEVSVFWHTLETLTSERHAGLVRHLNVSLATLSRQVRGTSAVLLAACCQIETVNNSVLQGCSVQMQS